jgi:hypothetical protein
MSVIHVLPIRFPKVRAFLWFDMTASGPGGHSDWPIETSTSAESAFAAAIASAAYAPNDFLTLNTSPIPPP